jgi:uncharacterized protein DUF3800
MISNLALVLTGGSGVASMINFGPVSTVNRSPSKDYLMRIIYFDEVKYHKDNQPYYWIGGIVVTPEAIWRLENSVSELSKACFGISTLSKETEFHAAEIFHRKRNFKKWTEIEKRISVLNKLAEIINVEEELAKIYVRIEPAKMITDNNIEDKAFMFFVEKVEQYLRANKTPGMLIGDKENERVSKQFSETLSQYREYGTSYQFGMELTHLIDTVHFTDSHHSRMLQLADIYVWLLQLCNGSDPEAHPKKLVVEFVKEKTNLLSPNKYKIWPTSQSWYQV